MSVQTALKSLVVAAVLGGALFSGAAYARDAVATVKLSAPVAEQTRIIALNSIWSCEGDTCLARPTHGISVRSCRHLVRELGAPVTAYGTEARQLSAEELASCNADVGESLQARN